MIQKPTATGEMLPLMGADVETFLMAENQVSPDVICLSMATMKHEDWSKDDAFETDLVSDGDPEDKLHEYCKELFSGKYLVVMHNGGGFDLRSIATTFPDLVPAIFDCLEKGLVKDTMIREMLLNLTDHGSLEMQMMRGGRNRRLRYALDFLVNEYLGIDISADKHAEDAWRMNYHVLSGVPAAEYPKEASEYAIYDSVYVLPIYLQQDVKAENLRREGVDPFVTEDFRVRAAFALSLMTFAGSMVDKDAVRQVRKDMDEILDHKHMPNLIKAGILIPATPPQPFKSGSKAHQISCHGHKEHPEHKGKAIKDCDCPVKMKKGVKEKISNTTLVKYIEDLAEAKEDVKIWKSKPTETCPEGNVKTNKDWLVEFAHLDYQIDTGKVDDDGAPVYSSVLGEYQYRQKWQKIVTDYLVRLEGKDGNPVGCIHSPFNVLKETGRTSSSKSDFYPSWNGQQVDPRVRKAIVPREGHLLLSADYGSMELGTAAQNCIDRFGYSKLGEIINKGWDPHGFLGGILAYEMFPEFNEYATGLGKSQVDDLYSLFLSTKTGDSDQVKFFKHWRKMAKPTGLGYPGGLGPETFRTYAKGTFGVKDLDLETARKLRAIWKQAFPEMKQHLKGINDQVDYRNSPKRFKNSDGTYSESDCYKYSTPLGLVRSGCTYTACANGMALQSPSAEGALLGAFELLRACYDETRDNVLFGRFIPHIFIHDEFLGDVLNDDKLQDCVKEITRIMVDNMQIVTPDVRASAEVVLMHVWNKYSDPAFDDAGNLIPWTEEESA